MNSHEPSPPPTAPSACPGCESLRQRLDEANRLMNAYRVKAHGLHSELDATLDRLSKSRASHKKIIAERDQTIAGLQVAINEMHIRAVDAEAGFPCVNERDTTITSLRDSLVAANAHAAKLEREAHKDRASIVAFLAAEAKRRDKEARSRIMSPDTQDQLRDEAVLCRTLELAIERGDDRLGQEPSGNDLHAIVCSTPVALHPIYTPEPSVSDAVLDSIRDVLGLRPGQDILAAVRLTKARAVENERLLTQRDNAVILADRSRGDAQHHGRLCGRLLDEIEALGYYTDRLLDPTLYAEAMKAAGREVKS